MPKIIAISLNTSIDSIIKVDNFSLGSVIRTKYKKDFASGKAVNSIRSITDFNYNKKLVGFCGYDFLEILNRTSNIPKREVDLIEVKEKTRQNITLIEHSENRLISHIQTEGYSVTQKEINDFCTKLNSLISEDDVVILSGSLPSGFNIENYKALVKIIKDKEATFVLDTSNEALKVGLEFSPNVIKPNIDELAYLIQKNGKELNQEMLKVVIKELLLNYKLDHVFITLGSEGAIYASSKFEDVLYGSVNGSHDKNIGDEIGCGDSFIGGIAMALLDRKCENDIFKQALALATSNLYSEGAGNTNKDKYYDLLDMVTIKVL